jgi:hypothetical protein
MVVMTSGLVWRKGRLVLGGVKGREAWEGTCSSWWGVKHSIDKIGGQFKISLAPKALVTEEKMSLKYKIYGRPRKCIVF